MKRVFSVLLLLCLLLSVIPVQSLAYVDGPYNIWGLDGDYGLVTVTPATQYANQPVTITPKPGYKITFLVVYPSDGEPLELTGDSSGYTFTMPSGKVEYIVRVSTADGSAVKHTVSVITGYNANPIADKQAAAPGEVVTITPNPSAGIVFDGLQVEYHTEEGYEQYILTNEPFFTVPDKLQAGSSLVVQVNYKAGSGGGNMDPQPAGKYTVTVNSGSNGTASANLLQVAPGETVTITATPGNDYMVREIITQPANGQPIALVPVNDNIFTFEMPACNVNITINFIHNRWANAMHSTDPFKNTYYANIDMEESDILDLLLKGEELPAGSLTKVYLDVRKPTMNADFLADKAAIETKAGTDTVAEYLDIKLFKQVDNGTPVAIPNPGGYITISMQLPAGTIPSNVGGVYIIYCHNGVVNTRPATHNAATGLLTFTANEFSTYALAYNPTAVGAGNGGTLDNVPKTGEASGLGGWILMALCCTAMLACVSIYDKKRAR